MLLCNETGMFLRGVQQLFRLMWCFSIIKLENKFRAQKKGNIHVLLLKYYIYQILKFKRIFGIIID